MSLQSFLLTLAAVAVGALITVQAPINALAAGKLGHPLAGAALSFCVGAVALLVVTLLVARQDVDVSALRTLPVYLIVSGGLIGAIYVTSNIVLAPRLGVAALMGLAIAGQLLAGLLLDRFGWFGLASRELSFGRLAGAILVVAGAVMLRFL